jgi:translation initiation factor IF-2
MAKMKITTLTDKTGDDEIFARLKSLGIKVKDKQRGESPREEKKEQQPPPGDTVIEKRIASTIIRRRVHTPPTPPPSKEEAPTAKEDQTRKLEAKTARALQLEADESAAERTRKVGRLLDRKIRIEPIEPPEGMEEKREPKVEESAPKVAPGQHPEELGPQVPAKEGEKPLREEPLKGDIEHIGEAKKQEITKVLEEAYKQDLETGVTLGESEEERKKKKSERLLKKIEEQEIEAAKGKKKGVLKRKVVIKEEDLYTFRRQKGKPGLQRRDRRDRGEERRGEEDKKLEGKPARKSIRVGEDIVVAELAKKMGVKAQEVIMKLLSLGTATSINQGIDFDTAYLVGSEFGFDMERITSIEDDFLAKEEEQKESVENLKPRPPVVTIMGHVDHGKTLLLDTIRHTNVAEREAGGITQHIGAYKVTLDSKEIVFIDTPGHEAFTSMRARGALVTDIVILVVAADDGVMPQTIEAINHAKSANVPIIVAVNKIDKANANPDRVLKDLANMGLMPEEWGGTTLFAKISAKKKEGISELLELIALQAEMLELKANPAKLAKGIIIESKLDKGHGPVGTVIIQEGTLKIHDPFIAGSMFGRVRAMVDDRGRRIAEAPPSTPLLVVGFQEVPHGGDAFVVTTEERYAKELSKFRQEKLKEKEIIKSSRTTLEELYSKIGESEKAVLNVILKGDVRGTIDAIVEALKRLSNEKVEILIIHSGVGAITETDVNLAMATGSIIVGFNAKPVSKAQVMAEHEKIDIRTYSVIYDMIDEIKRAMEGLLAPRIKEISIGKAEVRRAISVSKIGTVAGSIVLEGRITRNALVRVQRNGNILFTGKLSSLKRFKDDVKEVQSGYECGIALEGFNDIQEGDVLDFYVEEKESQTLDG